MLERLDVEGMLAKSCNAMGFGVMKSIIELERAGDLIHVKMQLGKRMAMMYYSGTLM